MNLSYLANYQTFESKQALNEATSAHLTANRYDLSETARRVLTVISRHAVKYPGVAHLKAATIASMIGMSEKTVRRAISRLVALRIVRKVVTMRKVTGGQGANIMQILPHVQAQVSRREEAAEPAPASVEQPKSENEPYNSIKQNNSKDITYPSGYASTIMTPYVRFKKTVGSFVKDDRLTNKLYGIYLAQTSYIRECHTEEELLGAGLDAVRIAFMATKRKRLRNIAGYFHGTLDRLLDRLYAQVISELM
ncbi:helix-turn-helix domain-containing protein [Bacillus massilinigeriensis]|uniref:helix-turn-helix domain-containing protein n=1 Tax=Bacillus mediterraneensis TaxID=1805474 RepID=UPI0008F95571|nr:helix-turn-helix domain-containing protein [Bacillus mediterraneensis]